MKIWYVIQGNTAVVEGYLGHRAVGINIPLQIRFRHILQGIPIGIFFQEVGFTGNFQHLYDLLLRMFYCIQLYLYFPKCQVFSTSVHDDCMSKQFVNDVASIAILATCWHEVPMPPLEGEVPNEREAEGFARKLSKKTPQSARSGCQLLIAE